MNLGIIGCGIVGSACQFGFEKLGHTVFVHDIKFQTSIKNVLSSEVVFICVSTPNKDGICDTSIVETVVKELIDINYEGIIVIRSTIPPGTTASFEQKYNRKLCFSPEMLRERCAIADFVENCNILAVGTTDLNAYTKIASCFGHYPKTCVQLTTTEAELLKYYNNSMGALRVVFANEFYEICQIFGADYTKIKNSLLHSSKLPDIYLDVNDKTRGYSSICWNKDIPALCSLAKKLGLDLPILFSIETANDKYKKTPFAGTREHY